MCMPLRLTWFVDCTCNIDILVSSFTLPETDSGTDWDSNSCPYVEMVSSNPSPSLCKGNMFCGVHCSHWVWNTNPSPSVKVNEPQRSTHTERNWKRKLKFPLLYKLCDRNASPLANWPLSRTQLFDYRSGTVNSNRVNSKFHLIRIYYEIFFYHFPNISCLKCTVNSNFHLIRSKTLLTNVFELTVPDLY